MSRTDTRPVRDINFPEKSGKVITRRNVSENGILLLLCKSEQGKEPPKQRETEAEKRKLRGKETETLRQRRLRNCTTRHESIKGLNRRGNGLSRDRNNKDSFLNEEITKRNKKERRKGGGAELYCYETRKDVVVYVQQRRRAVEFFKQA